VAVEINLAAFTFGEEEARALALAVTEIAAMLVDAEKDTARHARKVRIVQEKRRYLATVGIEAPIAAQWTEALQRRVAGWDETKRTALLIEVAFAAPFAPYEVKVGDDDHRKALGEIASILGLAPSRAPEILDAIRSAKKAHRHIPWARIAVGTVVGAVVVAAGGYFAAPLIAGYLGAAAGLSGAAAVAHGLALLGGGSLAAGGAGMAGGMLLVTSAGAAVGSVGAGGAAALWSAGYAAALSEIVKLQVSYREVLLRSHLRAEQAATVIERLVRQRDDLRATIAMEREMNDPGAARVEDLEKTERGYTDAIAWIEEQRRRAEGPRA
jgi:hypothetical protein